MLSLFQSKNIHVRIIGDSKLTVGADGSTHTGLSRCWPCDGPAVCPGPLPQWWNGFHVQKMDVFFF